MLRMNQNIDDHKRRLKEAVGDGGTGAPRRLGGLTVRPDSDPDPTLLDEEGVICTCCLSLAPPALTSNMTGTCWSRRGVGGSSSSRGEVSGWRCWGGQAERAGGRVSPNVVRSCSAGTPRASYEMEMSCVSPPSSHHGYNDVSTQ